MKFPHIISVLFVTVFGCKNSENDSHKVVKDLPPITQKSEVLFDLKPTNVTNIFFTNTVKETLQENYLNYEFIYNGSGLAAGDINNDGLPDLYFAGNSSDDKLYLNKGNFEFEDISDSSGIGQLNGWSTGVTMVDINADGWLDIYVSRSGPSADVSQRTNRLYINNKNNTFTEEAANFGIASQDYSVQSAFFDYDLDGDLDMYLLNHPERGFKAKGAKDHMADIKSGRIQSDRFYENVNGSYIEKSKEANLVNFGYRHGIAIGDINLDGYPDLYVSSDFEEPDLLLINNKKKGFTNQTENYLNHISFNSMGNDMVDINNDGLLDIFVVDMAPSDHFRSKAYMKSMDVERFRGLKANGYHSQYMFNTFQLNRGNNTFSEIAQYAGVAKTDWSWAPVFFDMDLDGYKDLFITNGIKENFLFRDIQKGVDAKQKETGTMQLGDLLDIFPSDISQNVFYQNVGGVKFKNVSAKWAGPSMFNSNGAVTADLDNDGDLDLVTNNMEANASIYENLATKVSNNNYVKIKLIGSGQNTQAIGSKVEVIGTNQKQVQELYTTRGYLSSNEASLFFGIGQDATVDLKITWYNGRTSLLSKIKANTSQTIDISEIAFKEESNTVINNDNILTQSYTSGINYTHIEDDFDDYTVQVLLPHSQSTVGPALAKADINGDGLDDVFIGGAKGSSGVLYLQVSEGKFKEKSGPWKNDRTFEDTGALWVDIDADGDLDLYVVSGGAHLKALDAGYQDRLYLNDGNGKFVKNTSILPENGESGKVVISADVDNDGDVDLFVGGRIIPDQYPYSAKSYLLINDAGTFTKQELLNAPMASAAMFTDFDGDGDKDLIIAGEWTAITVFENNDGSFQETQVPGLSDQIGIWFSLDQYDIDGDGDLDYFAGNIGLNSKFKTTNGGEFHIYCDDFDDNGTFDIVLSNSYNGTLVPSRGKECSSQQMPFISDKFTDYTSFASASLEDIYGDKLATAFHRKATTLASVYIENLGNGTFKTTNLPWQAQLAPISDFEFADINKDGTPEVISVGNLFNVEVETPRYDASIGSVLSFTSDGWSAIPAIKSGLYANTNARGVLSLKAGFKNILLVTNSNGSIQVYNY